MNKSESIADKLGFPPKILKKLGGISIMCGKIEYLTEQIIWSFKKEDPVGKSPSTDAKPITSLLVDLRQCIKTLMDEDHKKVIDTWVVTAQYAFHCRNTLLHGVVLKSKKSLMFEFITNTQWSGELRKRKSRTFLADEHTLTLLVEVFETLLHGALLIHALAEEQLTPIQRLTFGPYLRQLQSARSTVTELEDLPAAFNHEKY